MNLDSALVAQYTNAQGFIQDFLVGGGGEEVCGAVCVGVCKLGGSGGMPPPPRKIFFRSSQIASDTI